MEEGQNPLFRSRKEKAGNAFTPSLCLLGPAYPNRNYMRKLSTLWAAFPPTFTHSPLEKRDGMCPGKRCARPLWFPPTYKQPWDEKGPVFGPNGRELCGFPFQIKGFVAAPCQARSSREAWILVSVLIFAGFIAFFTL